MVGKYQSESDSHPDTFSKRTSFKSDLDQNTYRNNYENNLVKDICQSSLNSIPEHLPKLSTKKKSSLRVAFSNDKIYTREKSKSFACHAPALPKKCITHSHSYKHYAPRKDINDPLQIGDLQHFDAKTLNMIFSRPEDFTNLPSDHHVIDPPKPKLPVKTRSKNFTCPADMDQIYDIRQAFALNHSLRPYNHIPVGACLQQDTLTMYRGDCPTEDMTPHMRKLIKIKKVKSTSLTSCFNNKPKIEHTTPKLLKPEGVKKSISIKRKLSWSKS